LSLLIISTEREAPLPAKEYQKERRQSNPTAALLVLKGQLLMRVGLPGLAVAARR